MYFGLCNIRQATRSPGLYLGYILDPLIGVRKSTFSKSGITYCCLMSSLGILKLESLIFKITSSVIKGIALFGIHALSIVSFNIGPLPVSNHSAEYRG